MERNSKKVPKRVPCKVFGGKVLIIGDMHISCVYEGQHKNYTLDCYENMQLVEDIATREKVSAIIFLGDLIGVNERNIKNHRFLMRVLHFFSVLKDLTKGHVYSVKGNHDIGDFSDFDLLLGLGYIQNPSHIDYYSGKDGDLEVRFHLVNYGDEDKPIKVTGGDVLASNVVLGHADYTIEGVTNWYGHKGNVELSKQKNFVGVDLVISGHIHEPSYEIAYTALENGDSISLYYLGSPSRTAERYEDCWYTIFKYADDEEGTGGTDFESFPMGLKSVDEAFHPKEDFISESVEENAEKLRTESLTNIVKEIMEGRLTEGDIFRQIDVIPNATNEAKKTAKEYLRKAIAMK